MDKDQDVKIELYAENVGNLNYSTPPEVDRHLQIDLRQFSHPRNPSKELNSD